MDYFDNSLRHLRLRWLSFGVLVLGLSACTGTASTNSAGSISTQQVTVTATDLKLDPTSISATVGRPLQVTFVNKGVIEHDWSAIGLPVTDIRVESMPTNLSQDLAEHIRLHAASGVPHLAAGPGQQMVMSFTPARAGTYEVVCLVPGHKEAGMVARMIVGEPVSTAQAPPLARGPQEAAAPASAAQSSTPVTAQRLAQPQVAAQLPPRAPQTVRAEIEAKEVAGFLDDGVAYQYWTFGGTVPGPMLRVRQGDMVELTFKNAANSKVTHSIDLHAVTGPGGGAAVTQVAPGQESTFRFQALNPGVYVYHCATPPVAHHLASGMYGLIVVEPPGGLAPVDREFYVMQGDVYAQGNRGDSGERQFSLERMLDERPEYVVFNGAVGALVGDQALRAGRRDRPDLLWCGWAQSHLELPRDRRDL